MNDLSGQTLVIAAHPDDEVLGVGGTIPLIKEAGGDITVVIVTDGSSAQYPGDDAIAARKKADLKRANDVLGTDTVIALDLPDMRLDTVDHRVLNSAIEQVVKDGQFDTVFVHHPGDVNLDHQMIYRSTLVAVRPFPGQTVKRLLTYEVNSSTEWGARARHSAFVPNVYVDIEHTIARKLEALACYADELRPSPHPRSTEATRIRAELRGSEVGLGHAEAFNLSLWVMDGKKTQPR